MAKILLMEFVQVLQYFLIKEKQQHKAKNNDVIKIRLVQN